MEPFFLPFLKSAENRRNTYAVAKTLNHIGNFVNAEARTTNDVGNFVNGLARNTNAEARILNGGARI